jgi:hypothetical protein
MSGQGDITPRTRAADPIDPFEQWPRDGAGHLEGAFGPDIDLDELLTELDRPAG